MRREIAGCERCSVRDACDYEQGKQRAAALIERYQRELPSAMACLGDDLEASLAHLKLPALQQKSVRTTNLCERSFHCLAVLRCPCPRFLTSLAPFPTQPAWRLSSASSWMASGLPGTWPRPLR